MTNDVPQADFRLGGGWRECGVVLLAAFLFTTAATYPWVFNLADAVRLDSTDGQFSVWNVAWVARTLVADPLHVLDANIFHPHRGALAFSEMNLGAGILAIPAYWLTGNPYLAHNSAVLAGYLLCWTGMYYLARYLTGHRLASAVAAVCFTFCPFVFARTTEVQLLMTFGAPFTMLAFHRMVDRPTLGRGAALGAAAAGTTLFCAYYGVFVVLLVGFATLVVTAMRRRWTDAGQWAAVGMAAAVALVLILPLFFPYVQLERTGFVRELREAARFSSDWRSYMASSARAHAWLLRLIGHWNDVDFPGFVATILGIAGIGLGWRAGGGLRETATVYTGLAGMAWWASLGPNAGLYAALYAAVPGFTLMRAPSRFALLVPFALSLLAAVALRQLLTTSKGRGIGAAIAVLAAAELAVQLDFPHAAPTGTGYRVLAVQPPGPLIELPFFTGSRITRQTTYMLNSTAHWLPLVNGFSDYLPPEAIEHARQFESFPSREGFDLLRSDGVRYAAFHLKLYHPAGREALMERLSAFATRLRPIFADPDMRVDQIVEHPPEEAGVK